MLRGDNIWGGLLLLGFVCVFVFDYYYVQYTYPHTNLLGEMKKGFQPHSFPQYQQPLGKDRQIIRGWFPPFILQVKAGNLLADLLP